MSDTPQPAAPAPQATPPVAAATPPAQPPAAQPAPAPAPVAAAPQDPAAQERARIAAIMTCEAAATNAALAQHFAYQTSMSSEDAIAALKASAPAQPAPEVQQNTPDPQAYQAQRAAASVAAPAGQGAGQGTGQSKPVATIKTGEIYARRKQAMGG